VAVCYKAKTGSVIACSCHQLFFVSVPEAAKVKSYVTLERNGFVFLWYHAEGIDPVWEPPEIDEVASGQWKYCGRSEHFVNAHIEVASRGLKEAPRSLPEVV